MTRNSKNSNISQEAMKNNTNTIINKTDLINKLFKQIDIKKENICYTTFNILLVILNDEDYHEVLYSNGLITFFLETVNYHKESRVMGLIEIILKAISLFAQSSNNYLFELFHRNLFLSFNSFSNTSILNNLLICEIIVDFYNNILSNGELDCLEKLLDDGYFDVVSSIFLTNLKMKENKESLESKGKSKGNKNKENKEYREITEHRNKNLVFRILNQLNFILSVYHLNSDLKNRSIWIKLTENIKKLIHPSSCINSVKYLFIDDDFKLILRETLKLLK